MKTIAEVKAEIAQVLGKAKKIAIISDNDEDGLTSAVQVKRFFNKNKIDSKVFFYNHHTKFSKDEVRAIAKYAPNRMIFLDLADDFLIEIMEDIKVTTFISVDHHSHRKITVDGSRLIKPCEFSKIESSQYPTSKMCYDLFDGIDWVASIGIIGDSGRVTWEAFIKETMKQNNLTLKEMNSLAEIVSCIVSNNRDLINELFNFLIDVKSAKELLSTKFAELKEVFEKQLNGEIKRFDEDAENYPQLSLSIFRTKYSFTSPLSNELAKKYPSRTLIILNHMDNKCNASLRNKNASVAELRNDEKLVDCAELARVATSTINGAKGGGHIPAAGATFPEEKIDEFKKNIISYLKNKKRE